MVPIALFIIVFLIHLSYFTYERAILTQDTYLLAFRASVYGRQQETSADAYIGNTSAAQFDRKYLGSPLPEVTVEESGNSIRVHAQQEADHTAMAWYEMMPEGAWIYQANAKVKAIHRGKHIRRIDRILDAGTALLQREK